MNKKADLDKLNQQIAELTDALKRERADAMNVRRRSEEERAGLASFYKALVIKELLPVVDNFERALKHMPKSSSEQDKLTEWAEGIRKIITSFEETLNKIGVKRIKTTGEPFDPEIHEAVSMEEGDGDEQVVQQGDDGRDAELPRAGRLRHLAEGEGDECGQRATVQLWSFAGRGAAVSHRGTGGIWKPVRDFSGAGGGGFPGWEPDWGVVQQNGCSAARAGDGGDGAKGDCRDWDGRGRGTATGRNICQSGRTARGVGVRRGSAATEGRGTDDRDSKTRR